jgi:hypothetical protein
MTTFLVTIAHNKMRYCINEAETVGTRHAKTLLAAYSSRIKQWEARKGCRGPKPRIQVWKLVEDSK